MRSRMSWKRNATVTILAVGLSAFATSCTTQPVQLTPKRAGTDRPSGEVIFQLGKEDGSFYELTASGFSVEEYVCNVDAGCSTSTFPFVLRASNVPRNSIEYPGRDVERVTIVFELRKDYDDLVLRLLRGGIETLDVTVDGTRSYILPSDLFGSSENFAPGSYNLDLGAMPKGTHRIMFSVVPDGKDGGWFGWDALELIAPSVDG